MLILDKPRALDHMLHLSDRLAAVPEAYLRPSTLRWNAHPDGRRAPAGAVVLGVLQPTPGAAATTERVAA